MIQTTSIKRQVGFAYAIETLSIRLLSLQSTNMRLQQEIAEDPEGIQQYNYPVIRANQNAITSLKDAIELLSKEAKK